jgi:hypothetical protein
MGYHWDFVSDDGAFLCVSHSSQEVTIIISTGGDESDPLTLVFSHEGAEKLRELLRPVDVSREFINVCR